MRIAILAVGRLRTGPERELAERYLERARKTGRGLGLTGFEAAEIAESPAAEAPRRRRDEAAALVARVEAGALAVTLDAAGRQMSSEAFAASLAEWRDRGLPAVAFLIGGPDGHGAAADEAAALRLSLGAMTWPHQLARAMLCEQLYRAITILSGHPYHRA